MNKISKMFMSAQSRFFSPTQAMGNVAKDYVNSRQIRGNPLISYSKINGWRYVFLRHKSFEIYFQGYMLRNKKIDHNRQTIEF